MTGAPADVFTATMRDLERAARRTARAGLRARVARLRRNPCALDALFEFHPTLSLRAGRDIVRVARADLAFEASIGRPFGGETCALNARAALIVGRLRQWDDERTARLAQRAAA